MRPQLRAEVIDILRRDVRSLKRHLGGDITPARRDELLEAMRWTRLSLEGLGVHDDEEEKKERKR